ncbi:nitronate monooxygenase family protein [Erythrobacter sp. AP23]|uniref:NAD(P)H-dependent flavin oxidoreductase n=1 Tax=Erythrobacter sp. AP23 TaxID=499656 RepID=UPI00076C2226|nr:nitronate monooxygenase family protein [Erythrobacter sp. AP23]KWV93768.1 2-nitropropane dioxygenase [Erythrobacter sp. AP23]
MPDRTDFFSQLRLPVIAAPMFLVSGPELVIAAGKAGIVGTFPALNGRTSAAFEEMLVKIERELGSPGQTAPAPFGVNLIAHKTNARLNDDLAICVKHRVPLVITSIGAVPDLVEQVHGYGGMVFHDVGTVAHARKAAAAGVDGLVLISAGGGGHSMTMNPFAFLAEVREFFDGFIVLAGCLSTGKDIAAARVAGADMAYMGTRFICTRESMANDAYKQMIVDARADDVVHTAAFSGAPAMFLKESIIRAGLDPENLQDRARGDFGEAPRGQKAWTDILGAGQGVGSCNDTPPVATLVERLEAEYRQAVKRA